MKLVYNLDKIISALDYYDLMGLVKLCCDYSSKPLCSKEQVNNFGIEELENCLKNYWCGDSIKSNDKIQLERLMISCARENSTAN